MEEEVYSFTQKWIVTTPLLLTSFFTGLFQNSFSSTLIDFKEITNTTIDVITLGLTMRSIGGCIGALTSSVLFAKGNKMVVYSLLTILMGLMSVAIANITNLTHHLMLQIAIGIAAGVSDVGSSGLIFEIWKNNGGPFLQSCSFAWTISGVVSPLIFESFLSTQTKRETKWTMNSIANANGNEMANSTMHHLSTENFTSNHSLPFIMSYKTQSHIWIPYTLVGLFVIISGLMLLMATLYLCFSRRKQNYKLKSELKVKEKLIEDGSDECKEKNSDAIRLTMICGMFFFVYFGLNDTTWQFWLPFVMSTALHVSKSDGVYMISAMNISFAITNFLGIIVTAAIHPFKILVTLTSLVAIGNLIHLIFANSSLFMLEIGALIECAGFGCMYAALLNYVQREVGLTDKICSTLVLFSYLASAVGYSAIIGRYIEKTPMILIHSNLLIIIFMIVCLCCLKATERRVFNRKLKQLSNEVM